MSISIGVLLISSKYLRIYDLSVLAIALGDLCAAPSGSEIISSTTPNFNKSFAVSCKDSDASGAFSLFFHNIAAQPSGEITE